MTVQDMDICLNISTGPTGNAPSKNKGNADDFIINSMKGVKGHEFRKSKDRINDKSNSVSSNRSIAGKKRIKQKSLSAIVAKQLRESNTTVPRSILRKKGLPKTESATVKNKKFVGKVDDAPTQAKMKSTEPDKSSVNKNDDASSEPSVSFTKVTTENFGKTLLARKRTISDVNSKKTLSDVFAKQTEPKSVNFNILKLIGKPDAGENAIQKKKVSIDDVQQLVRNLKKSDTAIVRRRQYTENKVGAKGETDKGSHFHHKSGGKIASLFTHNPEIPNIGQRFVKPINEPVFTGTNFTDLNIHPFMISNLEQNMQITKMTTVQQKAIPQIFSGKDVLIRSQTGSGKTLAYALPIVELLHRIRPELERDSGLKALVIVPTRELALQTYECFLKLVKPFRRIVPGYISGGEKRKSEKARLRKGCNILVGTPGRVLDHIKHTTVLKLDDVKYFVLDEADRMFDMGYEKDISGIVSALKISTPSENTSYDAMAMLRQNVKKVFTDEDIGVLEGNTAGGKNHSPADTSNENQRRVASITEKDHSESEDDAGKTKNKQVYHSSSDSDSEKEEEPVVKSKKKKRNIDKKGTVKPESTASESNPQQDKDSAANSNPSSRQTILLSATLTQAVEKLAGLAMENPTFVDAAKENLETSGGDMSELNEDLVVPQSVIQSYIVTPPKLRMVILSGYIVGKCQSHGEHKILIFMATQDMVDYHADILSSVLTKPTDENDEDSDPLVDVEFFKLHGNMTQKERTDVFKTFRLAKSGVLLCTDVAARGLDMPKVDCVVQYTGPTSARDYVHRIGRTARAGCSGSTTIFLTPPEIEFVRMLESRRIRIKQEDMNDALGKLLGPLSKYGTPHGAAIALQSEFENMVLESPKLRDKACKAYVSWVRFYSTYPRDMREIFNRKDLHLGHYAKSFALRDTPQKIGGIGKNLREKDHTRRQHQNRLTNERPDGVSQKKQKGQDGGPKTGLLKKVRMLNTSEYGSGLEYVKKPKKS